MEIRPARLDELDEIMALFDSARDYMRSQGNPYQWCGGYPERELVAADIAGGNCFLCCGGDDILAVFAYFEGEEADYAKIYGGKWLNDRPYGVVHRLASARKAPGAAAQCLRWSLERCKNLKIDTHEANRPMQALLAKLGFSFCGTVYLSDGGPRIAFQKAL